MREKIITGRFKFVWEGEDVFVHILVEYTIYIYQFYPSIITCNVFTTGRFKFQVRPTSLGVFEPVLYI